MDIRYATHPNEIASMNTEGLRNRFLVEKLFVPGTIQATYSHHDRVVIAGVSPQDSPPCPDKFRCVAHRIFFQ